MIPKILSLSKKRRNPIAWALRFLKPPYPIKPKKGKGSYDRKKLKQNNYGRPDVSPYSMYRGIVTLLEKDYTWKMIGQALGIEVNIAREIYQNPPDLPPQRKK